MTTDFPHALAYLNSFKNKLDERNMPGRTTENWFAFGRSQSLKRFLAGEHLVWPVLSTSSNYVYDNDMVVFTGGGNGPFYGIEKKVTSQESIFYIQAILNHWLMELLVKSRASTFRGITILMESSLLRPCLFTRLILKILPKLPGISGLLRWCKTSCS